MSINTEGKGWKCWSDREHRGRKPHKLIKALTGCSWERAAEIAGEPSVIPTNFLEQVRHSLDNREAIVTHDPKMPEEFKPISRAKHACAPYNRYLIGRGLPAIERMQGRYDLRYAIRGPFQGRIIFPIRFRGKLVTWTGRAISPLASLRYLTLDTHEAAGPITDYLLWYDQLMIVKAHTIVLCEGPFDAIKLNELGLEYGLAATCFFTSSPSPRQISLLHELLARFKRKILLLDQSMLSMSLRVALELSALGVERGQLPTGFKDPGELSEAEVKALAHRVKIH